jgi:hypothetical protein
MVASLDWPPQRATVSCGARSRRVASSAGLALVASAVLWGVGCAGSKPPAAAPVSEARAEAAPERDEPLPEGPLTKQAIERVIEARHDRFQPCYDAGRKKDPSLRGKVMARITIDNDGRVAASEDAGSSMPDTTVVTCVLASFKKLRFPMPSESYVTVVYPMQFEAEPGGAPATAVRGSATSVLKSGPFRGCSVAEGAGPGPSGVTTQIECGSRKLVVMDVPASASSSVAKAHLERFEDSFASKARGKRSAPKLQGKPSWVTVVQDKSKNWGTMVVLSLGNEKTRVVECSGKPSGISGWCDRQITALARGFSPKGLLFGR